MQLSIDLPAAARLLEGRWWELDSARRLLGGSEGSTLLGYANGPDPASPQYVFLAADATAAYKGQAQDLKRSFVLLRLSQGARLLSFNLISGPAQNSEITLAFLLSQEPALEDGTFAGRFTNEGREWSYAGSVLLPASSRLRLGRDPWRVEALAPKSGAELIFLSQAELRDSGAPAVSDAASVASIDLVGALLAEWVVLFHRERYSARSAVSFAVERGAALKFLVTGLAPGTWEVWRNGWLEHASAAVSPRAGALYFEGRPGSYFLRRLG